MTFHRRSDWTDAPAANSNPVVASQLKGVAIHWNGPKVAATDTRSFLRGVHRYHTQTNKWSDIAYNLAVDQAGEVWVLRGLEHKSAANGSTEANAQYLAIYCLIGEGQKPSPAMIRGVQDAVARIRRRYPHAVQVRTHAQVRPGGTACPGPDLTEAVRAGKFDPQEDDPLPRLSDIAKAVWSHRLRLYADKSEATAADWLTYANHKADLASRNIDALRQELKDKGVL